MKNAHSMGEQLASFDAYWAQLRPSLEGMLKRRGLPLEDVEDVLQETALRFLARWERVDLTRSLNQLARAIAINYLIDRHRTQHDTLVSELPDCPSDYDLEDHALSRLRLGNLASALRELSPRDRRVLLEQLEHPTRSSPNTSAKKMARLRARARLRVVLHRTSGAFGLVQLRWRRSWTWANHGFVGASHATLPVVATTAGFAAATILSLAAIDDRFAVASHRSAATYDAATVGTPSAMGRFTSLLFPGTAAASGDPRSSNGPRQEATEDDDQVVDAGPARAEAGEGKGHRHARLCTSHGQGVWIYIYDGSQDPDDDPEGCRGGKKKRKNKSPPEEQRRVERRAQVDYLAPAAGIQAGDRGAFFCVANDPGIGCVKFETQPGESFLQLDITDATGAPVPAVVSQSGRDEVFSICGRTERPIAISPGAEIFIRLLAYEPGCRGSATSGTVTAVFSNLE